MKTVTLRYAVLTLATISMVAFAADKNLNAKDPFLKYFDSFVASPAENPGASPSAELVLNYQVVVRDTFLYHREEQIEYLNMARLFY